MGRHCCVLGCSTGVSLPSHMFPKDVIMMNKWKKAIYSEKIQDLTDEQLRKCVVCYRHFADSDYEAMYRLRRLKPGVIPSLYLPNNGNNNTEANNCEDNEIVNDHDTETHTYSIVSTRDSKNKTLDTNAIGQLEEIEIIEIKKETQPVIEVLESIPIIRELSQSIPIYKELSQSIPINEEMSQSIPINKEVLRSTPINEEVLQSSPINKDSLKLEPSSPKNSTSSLSDLHNLLHGKCFHKFTPKMWKLYKLSCILRKKQEIVIKRQLSFRERIRQAKQCSKSTAIEKLLSSLTPVEQVFLQMQIKTTKYASEVCKWNITVRKYQLMID